MFRSRLLLQCDVAKVEVSDCLFLHTLPCSVLLARNLCYGTCPPCPPLTSNMPYLSARLLLAGDMPLRSAQTNETRAQPHSNIPVAGRNLISSFLCYFFKDLIYGVATL